MGAVFISTHLRTHTITQQMLSYELSARLISWLSLDVSFPVIYITLLIFEKLIKHDIVFTKLW